MWIVEDTLHDPVHMGSIVYMYVQAAAMINNDQFSKLPIYYGYTLVGQAISGSAILKGFDISRAAYSYSPDQYLFLHSSPAFGL